MTIREAISEQLKSIKNRSLKEKISYFWEYYGIKTLCLILALAAVISLIVSIATKKEYAFTGVFFGAVATDSAEPYLSSFGAAAGIDPETYGLTAQCHPDIRMDQTVTQDIYQSMETFTAMVAAKSVDCFAGNKDLFLYYAYMEYATDLRTVLTQEELSRLSPYLYYMDGAQIRQQESSDEGYADAYARRPDPTKPELMQDPIPVAISLEAATDEFQEAYRFGEDALIGICVNSEHAQNALAFLRYCIGE